MLTISFKTIGCRLNQAETQDLMTEFIAGDFTIVSPKEKSDIFVINTCSVTHVAARKSRQALREFKNRNPQSFMVVLGCSADELKDFPEVDLAIGNAEKERAYEIIELKSKDQTQSSRPGADQLSAEKEKLEIAKLERTRILVKIQEGCDEGCAYCIVPRLRGKPRSLPADKILSKIKNHEAAGAKEIILTGVHIGQYEDGDLDLAKLVKRILQETKIPRIRLSSIEPQHFTDKILKMFTDDRICLFLHIPIQSGSDSILKAMGRKYSVSEMTSLVQKIKKAVPDIFLSTDIIVGFPGETETDFQKSYQFCEEMNFAKLHVFSYSKREGTKAAEHKNMVLVAEIKSRSAKLRALSNQLHDQYLNRFLGENLEILTETENSGVNREGVKTVWVEALPINEIRTMQVVSIEGDNLQVEMNEN